LSVILTAAFFLGIAHCETRGEADPDRAAGWDKLSFGRYQITDGYREDVNRIAGTTYTREDCFNPETSRKMMEIYLGHYATEGRLGHVPHYWEIGLIHHHGPNGWKRGPEDHYARTFNEFMEKDAPRDGSTDTVGADVGNTIQKGE